tara:strand:- start:1730 stop:2287 length:558 start_codon:yes stop_codon:yes gene_type:complete
MIKELIKIANELDAKGFTKEADTLDEIIREAQNKSQILPLIAGGEYPEEGPGEYESIVQKVQKVKRNNTGWIASLTATRGDQKAASRSVRVKGEDKSEKIQEGNEVSSLLISDLHNKTDNADALANTPWNGILEVTWFNESGPTDARYSKPFNSTDIPERIQTIMSSAFKGVLDSSIPRQGKLLG